MNTTQEYKRGYSISERIAMAKEAEKYIGKKHDGQIIGDVGSDQGGVIVWFYHDLGTTWAYLYEIEHEIV